MKNTIIAILAISLSIFNIAAKSSDNVATKATTKEAKESSYAGMDNVVKEVVYKNFKGRPLGLDIIQPKKQLYKDGSPAIICIHGGGWGGGKRYVIDEESMEKYGKLGITLVPISYSKATIEECVIDCFDAARFLAKNAKKYNIDPNRIAVSGHSAGGHLCLMLALAPSELFIGDPSLKDEKFKIICATSRSPICTLDDSYMNDKYERAMKRAASVRNMGLPYEESLQVRKKLSPLNYVTKDSPKVQIIHGNADTTCPIEDSVRMCEHSKKVGNEIELVEVDNANHMFKGKQGYNPGIVDCRHPEVFEFLKLNILKGINPL